MAGNGFNQKTLSLLVVMAVLVFSLVQPVYATPVFGIEKNLSSNAGSSTGPKISVSGTNVYTVWQDNTLGNNEVLFKASSDNGTNFGSEINLSSTPLVSSTAPKIASAGNNVYVAWVEGTGVGIEILFKASTDNGANFGSPITLSITPGTPASVPQITFAGSNVYVVWKDDNQIHFAASTNNGGSFSAAAILVTSPPSPFLPQVAAAGNSVYVIWQAGATTEIMLRASTDNGANFGSSINLSNSATIPSDTAQISAIGSSVYVTWEEGPTSDILFKTSSDNGANFSTEINLSFNAGSSTFPQISSSGTNVNVIWQDPTPGNSDILIKTSTDSGASFGGEINLSGDADVSVSPQVVSSGTSVYAAWQDSTTSEILFRSSSDSGTTFGGVINLSNNAESSTAPQIAASGANVYAVWQDGTTPDILFKTGTDIPVQVVFDQSNYRLTDTAAVTVTDPSANTDSGLAQTITVTMTSTLDPAPGIILTLTETGDDTGIFAGSLTFTTTPPSAGTALLAAQGNVITASYGGLTATSNIFTRTVAFDFDTYGLKNIAHITVTDQNSNLDDGLSEIISVHVNSTAQPSGIDLSLNETGDDTGIFGGPSSNLIFMPGDYLTPVSSTITITQHDEDDNTDSTASEQTTVKITSNSDPVGITLTLTETGIDTDDFSGELSLTTDSSVDGSSIKVAEGDFLTITHKGFFATNLLITPNPNPTNGAIQVLLVPDDTVTASYLNASDSGKVTTTDAPGGGGGGISRAGLVVNALGGLANKLGGGGGSSGFSNSAFGVSSFAIISGGDQGFGGILNENSANTFDQTRTFKVGEKAEIRFDFIEGGGIGNIEHIGLFANIRDGQKKYDSDIFIIYNPLKSPQATIHDANGLFSEATFEILQKDATNFVLKYDLTFAKPMAKSDLILESWNTQKQLSTNKIPNAIEVVSSGIVQEQTQPEKTTFEEDITNDQVIPVWVKTNAKWWSDGKLDNENFISGIEYLVNEGIIKVSSTNTSDSAAITEIQPWIKSTAGWWADDKISEDEFVTALQWLITNNIIQVA